MSGNENNLITRISTPARLHLGFLDLNGTSGRRFGSIGMAIDAFHTTVSAQRAPSAQIAHADPALCDKIEQLTADFYASLGAGIPANQRGVAYQVESLIPSHAGLGSGTQLALTIGRLMCHVHNITASTADIAAALGRGNRSGIGIATFDHGGFVVDGGSGPNSRVPAALFQQQFPSDWRIVLVCDPAHQGVHGAAEKIAFRDLADFPLTDAHAICHLTLMQLLPALVEQDLPAFGDALNRIQCYIGDHFAPAQGGRFSSLAVAGALAHATQLGHAAIAQSSWGPTGCIVVGSDTVATQLVTALSSGNNAASLQYHITCASRDGAVIR